MNRSAVFSQKRIGLNNKEFRIFKYRSMIDMSPNKTTDSARITFLGRILRVSRIDEFPQLFNILKGDMSFIGPRPLLPEYLSFYSERELRRHEVRPGLSGLSQVSGSYPSWEEQFEFDIQYVENISFFLDVKLFLKTYLKVLRPTKKMVSGIAGRVRFDLDRQGKAAN